MSVAIEDLLSIDYIHAQNIDLMRQPACAGVSTDSRTLGRGEIFFALRGESFDGNTFINEAFSRGAICAVVDDKANVAGFEHRPLLVVDDTAKALAALANVYRKRFTIPVIAVAGSNGKTTTKEMIAAILETQYIVLSTKGNLNNHIGVPQTLLRLENDHDVAVVEIGTNHFGEIQYLARIMEPTHGIITNIGNEHMEFFSDLRGVARAEGELFTELGSSGVGFVNADDQYLVAQGNKLKKKVTYGFSEPAADVRGTILSMDPNGRMTFSVASNNVRSFEVRLSVPGRHMMLNGLAAATVGLFHGVEIENIRRALEGFTAVNKRMQILTVGGITVINDSYNANPDSVRSALETLSLMKCPGKKIVVLGDMLELGDASADAHKNIGKFIRLLGLEHLFTFGPIASYINETADVKSGGHFDNKAKLCERLLSDLAAGDIVLIKGSRGMKMEEIVASLENKLEL